MTLIGAVFGEGKFYTVQVIYDYLLLAYSTGCAAKLRGYLIDQGMARDIIKRIFGSISSITNLAINKQGLGYQNALCGTFIPDGLRVDSVSPHQPLTFTRSRESGSA